MITKKRLISSVIIITLIIFNINCINAGLGLRPALIESDFSPGMKFRVDFQVVDAESDQKLKIYADGDFAEYVRFDKTSIIGQESFTAYVDLPEKAEKPGINKLYIKVLEDSESQGGISTKLQVGALIKIKVPYPGKYAEIKSFEVINANEGEPVVFNAVVDSLGNQELTAKTDIKIYSDEKLFDEFFLGTKSIKNQESASFSKTIEKGYSPGDYNATLFVDYGIVINETKPFRVGFLFVDILNWSSEFIQGAINEFEIEIESKWNNDIHNLYAEVNVTKDNKEVDFFKTPSIELKKWKKEKLKGFFNSQDLDTGKYQAKITLYYNDETTEKIADIKVVKSGKSKDLIIKIIAGVVVVLLINILIIYFIFKKKNRKQKI